MSYDPAFLNTASCKSRITFIDGDKGILRATAAIPSSSSPRALYLEVLTCSSGELPTENQYANGCTTSRSTRCSTKA